MDLKKRALLHGADGEVITENWEKSVIQFVLFSASSVQRLSHGKRENGLWWERIGFEDREENSGRNMWKYM